MELVTVKELYKNREAYLDNQVTVGGWVRSIRDSKTFGFIVVNDGSFFETLQVVYHDSMDNFAEISKLNVGAAIIVKGTLVATPQAKYTNTRPALVSFILYSSQLFTVLGNGMTSLIFDIPVRYITHLSNPSPNPACLVEPYFLRSR